MLEAGEDIFRASDIVPPYASDDDQAEGPQDDRSERQQDDLPDDISELSLEDSTIVPFEESSDSGVIDTEFVPEISEEERDALADTDISGAQQDEQSREDESSRTSEQNTEPKEKDTGIAEPSAESSSEKQKAQTDIPSFDLADDMMAGRRRAIAARRKAPGGKKRSRKETSQKREQPAFRKKYIAKAEPDPVVAEIVARDIDKMCRGAL